MLAFGFRCLRGYDNVYQNLFSDLGHKVITDLPNHTETQLKMQRVIEKFRILPDFKLTENSTISEFRTELVKAKKTLQEAYQNHNIFAEDNKRHVEVTSRNGQDEKYAATATYSSSAVVSGSNYRQLNG